MARNSLDASVIIPAYNAEKYLSHTLHALEEQTISSREIIVVDDGSTDRTREIANGFKRVHVLSQKNAGPAKARNAGARAAKGEIIVFLDSDCVPQKNWLEEMLKPFEDLKVVGVQGAYKTKQSSLVARFDQVDIEYRYERMKRARRLDWIGTYSAAYQKETFLAAGGFDESFTRASGEDAELSYRLSEKGNLLVFNPHAIVYHTHPESFWKFLEIEYFRAYWRMRMYVKHPLKAVRDSYTPHTLKVAVFLGAVLIVGAVLSVFSFFLEFHRLPNAVSSMLLGFALVGGGILAVNLPFLLFIFFRNALLVPFSIVMVVFRAIVFGLGVMRGFLDGKVRA